MVERAGIIGIGEAPEAAGSGVDVPDRLRLPIEVDAGKLADDLRNFGEDAWTRHFVRANYEGRWRAIPLRAPAGETHPTRMIYPDPMARAFEDTPFLDRAPNIRALLDRFLCPLRNVRLMSLMPGSTIKPHSDPDLDASCRWARLHVPIITGPGVEFILAGRPMTMEAGSVWYLRLSEEHQAANRGSEDRVHLVIDAEVDDWLAGVLRAGV